MQAARNQRSDRQVLVDVTAGCTALHTHRVSVPDHPHRTGSVVQTPGDRCRGEASFGEALVGVDIRCEEQCELPHGRQLARDEATEQGRHAQRIRVVGEHRGAVATAQGEMDVAAVALAFVEFRHEGQTLTVLVGDLFRTVLVHGVVIAGDQGVVVAEGDLLLPEIALALDSLAVHARAVHAQPDIAQQRLQSGGGVDGVVDVVVAGLAQAPVAGRPGLAVAVVEDDELKFGGRQCHQVPIAEPAELRAQYRPWRGRDHRAVVPEQIGDDQRRPGQPRNKPQRRQIRSHHHVAVPGLPARHRVAIDGVHVHVDGQEVVAALSAVRGNLLDEQPRRDPFAGQPALHVGEGDDDRVDLTGGHQSFQLTRRQQPAPASPAVTRHKRSLVSDGKDRTRHRS